jgi:hypothetical protein
MNVQMQNRIPNAIDSLPPYKMFSEEHEPERLIATYEPENGDGKKVEVFLQRMPSRCFRIVIDGFQIATGLPMDLGFIDNIAKSIAKGMLVIERVEK